MPFDDAELDALLFFGREREREIIVANLLASRLTVLYGPSGVGKTSLLRAGVAQQLRALADAEVAIFSSWSEDPTDDIDAAIADAGDVDLYLVLDQIEEYFLYHGGDAPFARRLPELVRGGGRVNILLGVREDALAKLDFFKGRIPNLFSNYLRLDHLDRPAARQAILGPLERLNELWPAEERYAAEPGLVEAVLDQVASGRIEYGLTGRGIVKGRDEPPRIEAPFLQLVLERLWDVEEDLGSHVLRLETLERLGGAETIVRAHLERALESLDPRQQELAAEIFDHLVTPSGTKIAHGVGDLAGYSGASRDELDDVLARLSQDRIVRRVDDASDGRFEIFHDVLAGGVLAWRSTFDSERELRRERKRRRRAVAVAVAALVALATVAAAALYALNLRDQAEEQARTARTREFSARALSDLTVDPFRSLRLAVGAAELERTPQVEDVLRQALLIARERVRLPASSDAATIAFDKQGRVLVSAGDAVRAYRRDGTFDTLRLPSGSATAFSDDRRLALDIKGRTAVVRDVATGRPVQTFRHSGIVRSGRFDPTGRFLALVAADSTGRTYAHIYRIANRRVIHVFRHRGARSVAFSPDGRLFATGSADDSARIWRLRDAELLQSLTDHTGDVLDVAFSPDGTMLATASADAGVRVWDVAKGTRQHLFLGHNDRVVAVAWSPEGGFLADASLDRTSRIYDVGGAGAGRMAGWLIGHDDGIEAVAYSPDGRSIATVSDDGTARIWDARGEHTVALISRQERGETRATLDSSGRRAVSAGVDGAAVIDLRSRRRVAFLRTGGPVEVARFDPSGTRVVTAGPNGAGVFTAGGRRLAALGHRGAVTDAVFSADGRRVVTTSLDGWTRVFAASGGALLTHLDNGGPATKVAVRYDGLIASAARDGTLRLWRPGREAVVTSGHRGEITALRFSPNGSTVLSAGVDGVVRSWNADSGALRFPLPGHKGGASDANYSPDGRRIVTSSFSRQVRLWRADGHLIRDLVGHFAAVNSAEFSPDGRWLVTTSALAGGLWQTRKGDVFAYLTGHDARPVRTAQFTADGRNVVTAGDDGTVRMYRCELCGSIDDLVALARARLARLRPAR